MLTDTAYGLFYDTRRYLALFFHPEEMTAAPFVSACFRTVTPPEDIPALLAPFFFADASGVPPIETVLSRTPFDDLPSFCEALVEDATLLDALRVAVLIALFPHDAPDATCSSKIAMQLEVAPYPTEFKYRALLCLTYFRHAAATLSRTLTALAPEIASLRVRHDATFAEEADAIASGRYDILYEEVCGVRHDAIADCRLAYSLFSPEIFHLSAQSGHLLVGLHHIDALLAQCEADNIDVNRFLEDIGNELKRMVLESLAEHGPQTVTELARRTGIPITTTLRHVETLCNDLLIRVSARRGTQVLYDLNRPYMEKARQKTNDYLTALLQTPSIP